MRASAEDYLETILLLSKKSDGAVRSIDIVNDMGFSKPSVSVAMKKLRENGLIVMNGGRISLTPRGEEAAQNVYERHQTLYNWLISIGVDENVASVDACHIEHVISDETFRAVKNWLDKSSSS